MQLPESLYRQVREIAKRERISINQFISTALADKLSALLTEEYLGSRALRGNRKKYESALSKVRDRRPVDGDA